MEMVNGNKTKQREGQVVNACFGGGMWGGKVGQQRPQGAREKAMGWGWGLFQVGVGWGMGGVGAFMCREKKFKGGWGSGRDHHCPGRSVSNVTRENVAPDPI